MLTVKIQKQYGSFMLDVDFAAGNVLALLGASGSGKSVTLKCAAGIDRPDRGRIELDGRVLFDSEKRIDLPPQKRKIGYLFQQYALFPHMTVEQNIAVCLRKNPRRQARTEELLAMFRLEDAAKLLPRQLSGGQQQRTALARILASEPDALLLDEPFAALDSHLKWQLEQELQDVLERFHGPVVWVSHDRGEVYRNCQRVCVLDHGKSSPAAALRDWMADPVTVCAARLSGCRNCVPARPGPGGIFIPDWGLTLRHAAPWRKNVTAAGIRAEQIYPARAEDVNAFLCRTVRVSEDFSVMLAALRPESAAPGAPLLQMEVRKEIWAALPCRDRFWAAVRPEDVLLLE